MGVEASSKKTEPLHKSNMVIAKGKRKLVLSFLTFFPNQQIQKSWLNRRNKMGVETSNKKPESLDQSNMVIAIGKRKDENYEPIMFFTSALNLGENYPTFFPYQQIQRS
jgi:hypothetical protein